MIPDKRLFYGKGSIGKPLFDVNEILMKNGCGIKPALPLYVDR